MCMLTSTREVYIVLEYSYPKGSAIMINIDRGISKNKK